MITKENLISTINQLDEPLVLDDILERIILLNKIEKGIEQSEKDNVITEEELEQRIQRWFI